jgi:hypothetical protein
MIINNKKKINLLNFYEKYNKIEKEKFMEIKFV